MSRLITIYDGGYDVIRYGNQPIFVGKIIFRASINESKPIDYVGYCEAWCKHEIINNLKKLCFPEHDKALSPILDINKEYLVSSATYKLRAESLVDVFLFLENIRSQLSNFTVTSIPVPGISDVEVTFDTELPFDEIKRELESIYNAQVMADTVQPIEKYTGERK